MICSLVQLSESTSGGVSKVRLWSYSAKLLSWL